MNLTTPPPPFEPNIPCEGHHLAYSWYGCTQCPAQICRLDCCCGDTRALHPPVGCFED